MRKNTFIGTVGREDGYHFSDDIVDNAIDDFWEYKGGLRWL